MSNMPSWWYRGILTNKYLDELNSPYTDQQRVRNINQVIDEKVASQMRAQESRNQLEVLKLKQGMRNV